MYILEITQPGGILEPERDGEWRMRVLGLLFMTLTAFWDACIAVGMFENQFAEDARYREAHRLTLERHEAIAERQRAIEDRWRQKLGEREYWRRRTEVLAEVVKEDRREAWKSGEIPRSYEGRLSFMYAEAYVHAVDRIRKLLFELAGVDGIPEELKAIKAAFREEFGDTIAVRNSMEHVNDRMRYQGPYGSTFAPDSTGVPWVEAAEDAEVLVLGSLSASGLGYTAGDGTFRTAELTQARLERLRDLLQDAMDAFAWAGTPITHPF